MKAMLINKTVSSGYYRFDAMIVLLLLLALPLLTSGCAALFVAGAGAGAYTYISGNLVREYRADFKDVVNACQQVIDREPFEVIEERGDGLEMTIEGVKEDGSPVTITINRLGKLDTEVGVRTGAVGYTNLNESKQLHDLFVDELRNTDKYAHLQIIAEDDQLVDETKVLTLHAIRVEKYYKDEQTQEGFQRLPRKNDTTEVAEGLAYLKGSSQPVYLYFNRSERAVPKRMYQSLDAVAETLKENTTMSLHVRGYTDSSGSRSDNIALSSLWAEKVRWYLIDHGIAPERIRSRGYGAVDLVETNRTSTLQAMNRRVELHFFP